MKRGLERELAKAPQQKDGLPGSSQNPCHSMLAPVPTHASHGGMFGTTPSKEAQGARDSPGPGSLHPTPTCAFIWCMGQDRSQKGSKGQQEHREFPDKGNTFVFHPIKWICSVRMCPTTSDPLCLTMSVFTLRITVGPMNFSQDVKGWEGLLGT